METSTILTGIGLAIAATGLVIKMAELKGETWVVLRRWGRRTVKVAHYLYSLVAIANGSAGILLFAVSPGMPTRRDIMYLLLFILNIAIGIWQFNEAAKANAVPKNDAVEP